MTHRTDTSLTIRQALALGAQRLQQAGIDSAQLDMSLLLAHLLQTTRLKLYLDLDRPLSDAERQQARELLARRVAREPVAYILGHREFFGLDFEVSPAVLVPRPETEHLVETALDWIDGHAADYPNPLLADIGTGSGAIAVAIAHARPASRWIAIDLSAEALAVARRNAERHGVAGRIEFRLGSLLDPIQDSVDAIISNPPYVPETSRASLEPEVTRWEPAQALFAGEDGLTVIRELIAAAPARLNPGGLLAMECGQGQAPAIAAMLEASGVFTAVTSVRDLGGIERVVRGELGTKHRG